MSTTIREMPLIGNLTGSQIDAQGGWPKVGLVLERCLNAARNAALDTWMEGTKFRHLGERHDLEARFRRLQILAIMAGNRRHAMQCTALGFPEQGRKHLARLFPMFRLEYAAWRAWGREPNTVNRAMLDCVLFITTSSRPEQDRHRRWVLDQTPRAADAKKFTGGRDLADHPLAGRVTAYLDGVKRKEWH